MPSVNGNMVPPHGPDPDIERLRSLVPEFLGLSDEEIRRRAGLPPPGLVGALLGPALVPRRRPAFAEEDVPRDWKPAPVTNREYFANPNW